MEQLLSVLYGVSGIAASALYIPQIIRYHRDPSARASISLLSWGGWIVIAAITIAYALCVVKSTLIAAVAGLNVLAQITVLSYGLRSRFRSGRLPPAALAR
ncbi:hypothetical protein [Noviherbaspirillum sp. ST9]|uniref:hypothetical protein n=1 Tax=Noviherbaspirillum sp. ST9 TaxID=3401606 RepID=UPI003B588C0C